MKINQIILEMSAGATGSGSVATVAKPMGETQSRYPEVKGLKLIDKLKGKKKGPYSNSLSESKVEEAKLEEDDLIIVPGQSKRFKPGLIPKAQDRTDHEVEMALSDLYQAYKNAKKTYMLLKNRTEEEGLEGWVQEKIIKANDYLNTIREYYEHQAIQNEMTGGVIGNGMAGESATKKVNPYAVGMAQAMKSTGDKPPLKKSTIVKGHHIAKKIKQQDVEEGWKSKLAGAALAGAAAFGGGGAHAGGMSLPPAGLTPAQSQEFTNAQFAGQQAINQHAAQQRAGKIDYRKDGPITKSSLGHKLEYGIPVNAKGEFFNPDYLENRDKLPDDEMQAIRTAFKTWLADFTERFPSAKQQPDGTWRAFSFGLAPMYPK